MNWQMFTGKVYYRRPLTPAFIGSTLSGVCTVGRMTGKLTTIVGCCVALTCLLQAQAPPICVPPGIQQKRLIYNVRPVYPKLAKHAHIQGTVRLGALIDHTGTVERLKLISGHPFLVKAVFDAVKQWLYQPAMYNGVPVAVVTTIDVSFYMGIGPPLPPDKPDARCAWVAAL